MANTIDLVTKHLPSLLDEVYKQTAKTADLEAASSLVRATEEANVVKIAKMDLDGLGDYDKSAGFPAGNINLSWETHTFQNDRGRKFNLDKMDNLESLGLVLANVTGEFLRTKVVPEKDAYTFAKIAGLTGIEGTEGTISDGEAKAALRAGIVTLENNEVDAGNLIIYATPSFKDQLEEEIPRGLQSGVNAYGQKIDYYNEIPIISVPENRFYSAITLNDGKTEGQTTGGYSKADTGVGLNFIVMDKNAVFSITKNALTKVFAPEVNQTTDGWLFHFRFYYDVFGLENKTKGIYVHKKGAEVVPDEPDEPVVPDEPSEEEPVV